MIGTMMILKMIICIVFISHVSDFHGVEPKRNVIKTTYDIYGFFSGNFEVVM